MGVVGSEAEWNGAVPIGAGIKGGSRRGGVGGRGHKAGQRPGLRCNHRRRNLVIEKRLSSEGVIQLLAVRVCAKPLAVSGAKGRKIPVSHRLGGEICSYGQGVDLANPIVVDKEEQLVAKNRPAYICTELITIKRKLVFIIFV